MWQTITSAKTSQRQVPAAFRKIDWTPGTVNADLGGGKYDDGSAYLEGMGVRSLVVDPFNRSMLHNLRVEQELVARGGADSVTICNVLNVIQEAEIRLALLIQARAMLRPGGRLYISVYAGDRSGIGKSTSKGWQEHRPLRSYLADVLDIFPDAMIANGMITASR